MKLLSLLQADAPQALAQVSASIAGSRQIKDHWLHGRLSNNLNRMIIMNSWNFKQNTEVSRSPFTICSLRSRLMGISSTILIFVGTLSATSADTLILRDNLNSYTGQTDTGIRSDQATGTPTGATTPVGYTAGAVKLSDLFSFNLSTLPTGATINSISLTLTTASADASTDNNVTLGLYATTKTFVISQATWNLASTGNSWTTPGGDYSSSTLLSSLTTDPTTALAGTALSFSSSSAFVSTAQAALDGGTALQFLLTVDPSTLTPGARAIFQLATDNYTGTATYLPTLTIDYTAVPEPTSLTLAGFLFLGIAWRVRTKRTDSAAI